MSRRFLILCAAALMVLAPLTFTPGASADAEKLLYSFPFDDDTAVGRYFEAGGGSAEIEWVASPGVGRGDAALKVTHIEGAIYNSAENAVRLTLPEPLPAGGVYRVVAWVYASSDENPGKGALTGPGFVLNGDYTGDQGVIKFPPNFGTLPLDEWKGIDVTLPLQESPVNTIEFRIVINEASKHPDVWYWDNIEIYQVGELQNVTVPEWDLALESLCEAYQDYFLLGNILEPHQIADPKTAAMFKNQYNAATAGNSMKPIQISPEKDAYNFSGADTIVDWALENGIAVHGHTLVWHSQSAEWPATDGNGAPLTRAEAKANLENYINTTAGHFKGKVISWDVVNEAFTDSVSENFGDWRKCMREESPWYKAYANGADADGGESPADFIYDAFVFARLADPGALLYYIDFNEEERGKCEAMSQMTVELNEIWKTDPRNTQPDRLLVEGIGMQAHYWTDQIKVSDVEASIQRFIKTGARISISEIDIPFGTYGDYQKRTEPPTESELKYQAELYGSLFELFVKYADHIDRVTVWGLADSLSWRWEGYPLMFDKYFSAKPSFRAALQAAGIAAVTEPKDETSAAPTDTDPASEPPANTATPADNGGDDPGFPVWIVFVVIGGALISGIVIFVVVKKR